MFESVLRSPAGTDVSRVRRPTTRRPSAPSADPRLAWGVRGTCVSYSVLSRSSYSLDSRTCAALEIREFARSGILYYLVRPVLFPEFTTQLTVAPRSRSLPDLNAQDSRGSPDHPNEGFEIRELQPTDCSAAGGRARRWAHAVLTCRRVQREAAMPRPKGGGGGGAAAAAEEEDAPSTQQVRASVAWTEALVEWLDELRGRIAGEAESDLSLEAPGGPGCHCPRPASGLGQPTCRYIQIYILIQ